MPIIDFLKELEDKVITTKKGDVFCFRKGHPVRYAAIAAKEEELGIKLPQTFVEFLTYAGEANYFGARIFDLRGLYIYDDDYWEMKGFLPFYADNSGAHFAFGHGGDIVESPVYKCREVPLGYAKVATDFADWLRVHYRFVINIDNRDSRSKHPYVEAESEIIESNKRYQKSLKTKWWQRKERGAR